MPIVESCDVHCVRTIFLGLSALLGSPGQAQQSGAAVVHPGAGFRRELGLDLQKTHEMVIVYGEAAHFCRTESSVVASRTADGRWSIQRVDRTTTAVIACKTDVDGPTITWMSKAQGRRLDGLLSSPAVFKDRVRGGEPSIGGFNSQMEIVTPLRNRTVHWSGKLRGSLGKIADLVIGK